MPAIQIYLNQQLFDFVKDDKSKIIQQALKELIQKQNQQKNSCHTTPTNADVLPA